MDIETHFNRPQLKISLIIVNVYTSQTFYQKINERFVHILD